MTNDPHWLNRALGQRIAELRKAAGLSQKALADAVGTAEQVVSRIERGAGVPSLARLAEYADALGVEIGELFAFRRPAPARTPRDAVVARFAALARRVSVEDAALIVDFAAALLRPRKGRGGAGRA